MRISRPAPADTHPGMTEEEFGAVAISPTISPPRRGRLLE